MGTFPSGRDQNLCSASGCAGFISIVGTNEELTNCFFGKGNMVIPTYFYNHQRIGGIEELRKYDELELLEADRL